MSDQIPDPTGPVSQNTSEGQAVAPVPQPVQPQQPVEPQVPQQPAQQQWPVQPGVPSQAPAPVPVQPAVDQNAVGQTQGNKWEAAPGAAATVPSLPSQWGNPLTGIVPALVGLAASYVATLVLLLLAVVGSSMSSAVKGARTRATSTFGGDDGAADGFFGFIQTVIQMASMSWVGPLHLSGAEQVASVTLPLLSISAVAVAAAWYAARVAQSKWGGPTGSANWITSSMGAVAAAALMTIVARVFAFRSEILGTKVSLHAASFQGFLICAIAMLFAVAAGRARAAGVTLFGEHPVVREAVRGMRTFAYHFVSHSSVAVVLLLVISAIKAIVDGGIGEVVGALFAIPLVLGSLMGMVFGLGNLGGMSVKGGSMMGGSSSKSEIFSMFDFPWYNVLVLLVVGLLAIALTSMFWAARRRVGGASQQAQLVSWGVLPVVYLFGGCLLLVLVRISAGSMGMGMGISFAPWMPFVMMLVGLLVDVAARFLAPVLVPFVPARLYAVAGGTAAAVGLPAQPVQAAMVDAQGAPLQPSDGASVPGAAPVAAMPQAQPMSPEAKRRAKIIAIVVGAGLAVLVAAIVGVQQVNKRVYGPQHQAESALQALADGQPQKVVEQLGAKAPEGNRALLTSEVYGSTEDRIEGYTLGEVRVHEDKAYVEAQVKQPQAGSKTVTMVLTKDGKEFGLFDKWTLTEFPQPKMSLDVPAGVETIQINGKDFKLSDLGVNPSSSSAFVSLPAFPGSYKVKVPDQGKYYLGSEGRAVVGWAGEGSSPELRVTLSDQATKDVEAAVKAKLDECAKSTAVDPGDGCPFDAYAYGKTRNVTWKIDNYPTVKVSEMGDGLSISSEYDGKATVNFEEVDLFDEKKWEKKTSTDTFSVYGSATINGDQIEVKLS